MIGIHPAFNMVDGLRLPQLPGSCGGEAPRANFAYCASCGRSACSQHTVPASATSLPLLCPPLNSTEFSFSQPSLPSDPSFYSLSSSSSTQTTMCSSPEQLSHQNQRTAERQPKAHPTLPGLTEKNRKAKYVDALVDTTALVINSIWNSQPGSKKTKLVNLRVFIQEVLRRSRTTYSTLQTALFYLFRVKNLIISRQRDAASKEESDTATFCVPTAHSSTVQCNEDDLINCGRRMFLASLMIASKYLQDKNYRNKAWAKIAGLSVAEINATEIAFLKLIDYNLFISKTTFERWYALLHGHVNALCCVEGSSGNLRDEPNISLAGDTLFQVSTDGSSVYESPLPSPTSPNPPRLPSPSSALSSTSSGRSMLTPDSGVLSPVEGTLIAPRSQQHYHSPSPSPPLRKATTVRHGTLPSLHRQATTTAALLQNVMASCNIRSYSLPLPARVATISQSSSPSENTGGKRTLGGVDIDDPEFSKRLRLEDDGYGSDEGTVVI